jgi:hypothetical protein
VILQIGVLWFLLQSVSIRIFSQANIWRQIVSGCFQVGKSCFFEECFDKAMGAREMTAICYSDVFESIYAKNTKKEKVVKLEQYNEVTLAGSPISKKTCKKAKGRAIAMVLQNCLPNNIFDVIKTKNGGINSRFYSVRQY